MLTLLNDPWFDFDAAIRRGHGRVDKAIEGRGPKFGRRSNPTLDVIDRDDHVEIVMDLPGVDRDDIQIEAEGDYVIISGSRTPSEDRFFHQERWSGEFHRRCLVDATSMDLDAITAKLEAGVLTVLVPRRPEAQPRRITIE